MAIKYTQKFMDISTDPPVAITDAISIELQHTAFTYPANALAMVVPADVTGADTGWREVSITRPGSYDIYLDTVKDTNRSPIKIETDASPPWVFIYKKVTIAGTSDSKENLTIGAGKLASAGYGGTPPTFSAAADITVVLVPRSDRTVAWDTPTIVGGAISFDIWAADAGQDDTAYADIHILYVG